MNPLISVIVPVYNVKDYLNRCVESIVAQTYQNLEIILVDDGSTDGSGALCDEWATKDSRIRVIHKPNGGLSDARNAGMAAANGQYWAFLDSDDWIEPHMYQLLYSNLKEKGADIVECCWEKCGENDFVSNYSGEAVSCLEVTSEQAISELMHDGVFRQTVWNKLYDAEVIKGELFPIGRIHEDEAWTYRVFGNAKKLVHIDVSLYRYFQREGSIIHQSYSLKRLHGLLAKRERAEYIKERFPGLYGEALAAYAWGCLGNYQKICENKILDADGAIRKDLHMQFKNACKREWLRTQPLKQKVWLMMFYCIPDFACMARNALKIGF